MKREVFGSIGTSDKEKRSGRQGGTFSKGLIQLNDEEQTLKKGDLVTRDIGYFTGISDENYGFGIVTKAGPWHFKKEKSVEVYWQKLGKKVNERAASLLYMIKDDPVYRSRLVQPNCVLGGYNKKRC